MIIIKILTLKNRDYKDDRSVKYFNRSGIKADQSEIKSNRSGIKFDRSAIGRILSHTSNLDI